MLGGHLRVVEGCPGALPAAHLPQHHAERVHVRSLPSSHAHTPRLGAALQDRDLKDGAFYFDTLAATKLLISSPTPFPASFLCRAGRHVWAVLGQWVAKYVGEGAARCAHAAGEIQ